MKMCVTNIGLKLRVSKATYCLKFERSEYGKAVRKAYENGEVKIPRSHMRQVAIRKDGCSNTVTTVMKDNLILEVNSK